MSQESLTFLSNAAPLILLVGVWVWFSYAWRGRRSHLERLTHAAERIAAALEKANK